MGSILPILLILIKLIGGSFIKLPNVPINLG